MDEILERIVYREKLVDAAETTLPQDVPEIDLAASEIIYAAELESRFGKPLYASAVLLIAAVLESRLAELCRLVELHERPAKKFSQGRGSSVRPARAFLRQLASWPMLSNETWEWLQDLVEVRNCIAHWGGKFSELSNTELREKLSVLMAIAQRRGGIAVEPMHELTIEDILAEVQPEDAENGSRAEEHIKRRLSEVALVVSSQFCSEAIGHVSNALETLSSYWNPRA